MTSRSAVAVFAGLVAGSLAYGQQPAAAPPAPAPAAAPAPAPTVPLDPGVVVSPETVMNGPGTDCGCWDFPHVLGPRGRMWAEAEALLWWMKGSPLPILATTARAGTPGLVGTQQQLPFGTTNTIPAVPAALVNGPTAVAGVLGQSTTSGLFGGHHANEDDRFGGRATVGFWFDEEQTLGVEANALVLGNRSTTFSAGGGGQIVAVPFINTTTQATFTTANGAAGTPAFAISHQNDAFLVNFPGLVNGRLNITSATDGLVGAGLLFRENFWGGCNYRVDVVGGYRFLQFADRLAVNANATNTSGQNFRTLPFGGISGPFQSSLVANGTSTGAVVSQADLQVPANFIPGASLSSQDRFDCTNDFHGFDFGLTGEYRYGPWRLAWTTKLAIGENFEIVDINGQTVIRQPGGATFASRGGLLALTSNIGHLTNDRSVVIPEAGLQVGAQLTPHVRGWVGYTGLYWSEVVLAGKQIDAQINPNLLPPRANGVLPPITPLPHFGATSMWAQGLDVGLEVRY